MADTHDSKSCAARHEGSTPSSGTSIKLSGILPIDSAPPTPPPTPHHNPPTPPFRRARAFRRSEAEAVSFVQKMFEQSCIIPYLGRGKLIMTRL